MSYVKASALQETAGRNVRIRVAIQVGLLAALWLISVPATAQSLQVVAHQDDDTLFMIPDLRNSLQAGSPSTTVYITAGEAAGCCIDNALPAQTREQFAANRQEGARAAYAAMMGITVPEPTEDNINTFPKPIDSYWTRSLCQIRGAYVEVDQLKAYPQVQLVFLNVPDAGDAFLYNGTNPTYHLFADKGAPFVDTIVPQNWPTEPCIWPEYAVTTTPAPQTVYLFELVNDTEYYIPVQILPGIYDHDKIIGVLSDLAQRVRPAVVRTLDPYPYERGCGPNDFELSCYPVQNTDAGGAPIPPIINPYYTGYAVSYDNTDHQMAGRLVREVLAGYSGHRVTLNYMGYSIADRTGNLSDLEYVAKKANVDAYGAYEGNYLGALSILAKNQEAFPNLVGSYGGYLNWFGAMYERNPSNATWLQRFRDGRLVAFGTNADRPAMWYEACPGADPWYGPIALGKDASTYGPVVPGIAVGKRTNGLLQLFFLRAPQPPMQGSPAICTVAQSASSNTFGAEVCLGTPSVSNANWTSPPAVATDANGYYWVFVKNDRGGVSANQEVDSGVWAGWTDLPGDPATGEASGGGPEVIESIVSAQDALGRLNVFAQTRFGVIHQWYQQVANGPWVFVPVFPSNAPVYSTHGLATAKNADGRLEVFYRGSGRAADPACGGYGCNAQVFSVREQSIGGPWGAETDLFGDHGHGPLAVVLHPSGPLQLFELNYQGGVSKIGETTPSGSFYPFQWQDLGGRIVDYPSTAIDSKGRTALAAFGLDGKLYLRRQQSTDPSTAFAPWTLADTGLMPPLSPKNLCVVARK